MGLGGIAVNLGRMFLKEVIEKVSPPFEGGVSRPKSRDGVVDLFVFLPLFL
jgi:hypothetical protein